MNTTILVAGATGNLGGMIVSELVQKGARVRALVRPSSDPEKVSELEKLGVEVMKVDAWDVPTLTTACADVSCVVSVIQGLHDVIVDAQSVLLDAAVAAGVPRFIPSDFASDYTKVPVGDNRNFDLRHEFRNRLDATSISATSILNGAFAEILGYGTPLLNLEKKSVGYWGSPDWKVDYTTMENTAAYTASAAMDSETPRILRIASFQISPTEMAAAASEIMSQEFTPVSMGTVEGLGAYAKQQRAADPEGEAEVFPAWQQSQYMQSMFSVQHESVDNARYLVKWTSFADFLTTLKNRGGR